MLQRFGPLDLLKRKLLDASIRQDGVHDVVADSRLNAGIDGSLREFEHLGEPVIGPHVVVALDETE